MVKWKKQLISAIAASSLLLGTSTVANAVDQTEEALLVPGATVFKQVNPLYSILAYAFYPDIGIHFHNDDDPQVIDYSQNALAADKAIQDGVEQTNIAVQQVDGKVVVIGESMGSMVAARLAVELANSENPPSTEDISFVLIAPPEAGIAEYFKEGTFIPVLNYRISRVPQSPYTTTIVIGEYDGWADPPDRPWNLPALVNALLGTAFVHGPPIAAADPAKVPEENITPDGNVTTYLVPTEDLPLTQPPRLVGIPDEVVDKADRVLRPVIDAGYRRHDKPGDPRPYLSDGEIQHNVQSQQLVRERWQQVGDERPDDRQNRSQQRQQRQADRLDRIAQGIQQLAKPFGQSE